MNLLESYDHFKKSSPASKALQGFQDSGYQYVQKQGLPTRHDEDWHYTSLKTLADNERSICQPLELSKDQKSWIQNQLSSEMTNLVFVNSKLEEGLSSKLPQGLTWKTEAGFNKEFQDSFEALNAAYTQEFYALEVASEVSIKMPVRFIFVSTADSKTMTHPRLKVTVNARSIFHMVESFLSLNVEKSLTNSFVELSVGEGARVTYVRTEEESENSVHIGRTHIQLQKDANLESLCLNNGALLSRHSLKLSLLGTGSNSEILGLYATKGRQHIDNTSWIEHHVGGCNTNQLYKGILDDESRAVFAGTVYIAKDAQKANSAQLNNNLILSEKAEADSKPCLNIYADDVKAAHGSTVGQLNKEELFYLLSRAIPKEKAISMMAFGFLSEVVYKISNPVLQNWLIEMVKTAFDKMHVEKVQI